MTVLNRLLETIVEDPQGEDRWLVLADWLDDHDDPRRAELLRLHRPLLATCCEPERHPERVAWQRRVVELLGEGVEPCVPQRTVTLGEPVEMTLSFIPPGSFLMGSPESEEGHINAEVRHRVTLTRGFWLSIYPVTQAQWAAVMGSNPSRFKGDTLPVEMVSPEEIEEFCSRMSRRTAESICLPSEVEWEYACRAGTTTAFHFGEKITPDMANYANREQTSPVGSFPPNAWGLFDMHGNVFEPCRDWYDGYPTEGLEVLSDRDGPYPACRGGAWHALPLNCRSARRFFARPENRYDFSGCRVCLYQD